MLNVNNFIMFFFKSKNFYFNFFYFNNINVFLFLLKLNKANPLVLKYELNNLNLNFKLKSFFFIKINKNFNVLFSDNIFFKNQPFFLKNVNFNNHNFFYFDKFFYKHLLNFSNVVYNLTVNKNNFLILDNQYNYVYPLYNYMYSHTNVNSLKEYFFVKPLYFTYKRWIYFYANFCRKFNVELLILFNYTFFLNYINELQSLDKPITALVPVSHTYDFIDFPIFIKNNHYLNKFIYTILISQFYFLGLNFKNYQYKIKFIRLFYNFSKSF